MKVYVVLILVLVIALHGSDARKRRRPSGRPFRCPRSRCRPQDRVTCASNPCQTATCEHQGAVCCPTNCGGCGAVFYDPRRRRPIPHCFKCPVVTCNPPQLVAVCEKDACEAARENNHHCTRTTRLLRKIACCSNNCGGCNAVFYKRRNGRPVPRCNRPEFQCPVATCAPGTAVNCPDPCAVAMANRHRCTRKRRIACCSNHCNTCNAVFYSRRTGQEIPRCNKAPFRCPAVKCKPGMKENCITHPCKVNKCPKHPKAKCCHNFCAGCNAVFYDPETNKELTDC